MYRPLLLFLFHILYQCIDNLILFNITLNYNHNKSIVRALEREKSNTHHIFPNLGQMPEEPVTLKTISLSAHYCANGLSLPVSAMLMKHGKNFTTAKIFKQVCKTLFVTVIILATAHPEHCSEDYNWAWKV